MTAIAVPGRFHPNFAETFRRKGNEAATNHGIHQTGIKRDTSARSSLGVMVLVMSRRKLLPERKGKEKGTPGLSWPVSLAFIRRELHGRPQPDTLHPRSVQVEMGPEESCGNMCSPSHVVPTVSAASGLEASSDHPLENARYLFHGWPFRWTL